MEVGRSGWEDFRFHAFTLLVKQRAWRTGHGRAGRVCCLALSLGCLLPPRLTGYPDARENCPSVLPSSLPGTLHK